MKIQIKTIAFKDLFPNKSNLPKNPYTRDLNVCKTPYTSLGKKYQAYPYTKKELAEKISSKLSMPVVEVMESYKDKIQMAYDKNIEEYIKAYVTDYGLFWHKNLKGSPLFTGVKSVHSMIPAPPSLHLSQLEDITIHDYKDGLFNLGGKWIWFIGSEVKKDARIRKMLKLKTIQVEYYDHKGNIVLNKPIEIVTKKDILSSLPSSVVGGESRSLNETTRKLIFPKPIAKIVKKT